MWKNLRTKDELSIEQWKEFILDLKRFTQLKTSINITGGEPFLKHDVLDLVRHTTQEGFKGISMTTNGFLIDIRLAQEISASGLAMISFSLDSIDADIHDNLRGIKGSCQKVMAAIGYLLKDKVNTLKIGIQTIIMGPTLGGIPELIKWASSRGVSIYFMAIAEPLCASLGPDWFIRGDYSFLWPHDFKKRDETIELLIQEKKNGADIGNSLAQLRGFKTYFDNPEEFVRRERKCRMGDGMVKIGPTGDVSLCGEKGAIGNICNSPISEIWFSEKAKSVRGLISSCRSNCPQMINCYFED